MVKLCPNFLLNISDEGDETTDGAEQIRNAESLYRE